MENLKKQPLTPMQELEKEFQKQLEKAKFPNDKLHSDFSLLLQKALQTLSIVELNCDLETYKKIVENYKLMFAGETVHWNLMLISYVFNSFSKISPKVHGISVEAYVDLLVELEAMPKHWNEMVSAVRLEVAKKFQKLEAQKNQAPKMAVVPNKRK